MRAQTGAFDKISFQGMTVTGSLDKLPSNMNLFSFALSSGSSAGELCACKQPRRDCQRFSPEPTALRM